MNKYNGWTNWETWQILLWADSCEVTSKDLTRFVRRFSHMIGWPLKVEEYFRQLYPTGTPDMDGYHELDKVDWQQIADHLEGWYE
jgi:hypothetical protein